MEDISWSTRFYRFEPNLTYNWETTTIKISQPLNLDHNLLYRLDGMIMKYHLVEGPVM